MPLDASDSSYFSAENEALPVMQRGPLRASSRLVVALDKPTVSDAQQLVDTLGDEVEIYKIGLELVMSGEGLDFAKKLQERNKKIFLDMKLLDIPNTVEKAVANAAQMGFDFLTVHGIDNKTLAAAVKGRKAGDKRSPENRLKLLSVTVLTSTNEEDLRQQKVHSVSTSELAVHRAVMAYNAGFDGVIASGHEAKRIRERTNESFIVKVPGIRPTGSLVGDQSRVMTPTMALRNKATYLVVGRPITHASDPLRAVREIVGEMTQAIG